MEPLLCCVWVTEPSSRGVEQLDLREQRRWSRLHHDADRARFVSGVLLQRLALRQMAGVEVALTRWCPGCSGDDHGPVTPEPPFDLSWSMSLSHSGERVVVAATEAGSAVGVDVEQVRPRDPDVVRAVLTPAECAEAAGAQDESLDFATRWVRKEAVLKATRDGLNVPLRDLEVTGSGRPPELLSWSAATRPAAMTPQDVAMSAVETGVGYVACVAVVTRRPLRVVYC